MICASTYLLVKRTTSLYLGELYLFLSCGREDGAAPRPVSKKNRLAWLLTWFRFSYRGSTTTKLEQMPRAFSWEAKSFRVGVVYIIDHPRN